MKTKKEGPKKNETRNPKNVTKNTSTNVTNTATKNVAENTTTVPAKYGTDESRREHNMAVIAEVTRRIAAAVERLRATPVPPGVPWLLKGETEASVRRTIARLRNGTIVPADPAIDPLELADLKERQQAYRLVAGEVFDELKDIGLFLQADLDSAEAELLEDAIATFNAAKQLPGAKDPDSEIGQSVRRMDRARRHDTGPARVRPVAVRRAKRRKR
jgi:hypothetical protein